jgi:hypothetical protein
MPQPKSKPIDGLWAEHIKSALTSREVLPSGDGWLTAEQFQKLTKMGLNKARAYLSDALAAGKVERFAGKQSTSPGVPARQQFWYRPKA